MQGKRNIVFWGTHFQYFGQITHCSETDMNISTAHYIPCDDRIEIIIPGWEDEDELSLSARIRRVGKADNTYDTLNVEILNPPNEYYDYVSSR